MAATGANGDTMYNARFVSGGMARARSRSISSLAIVRISESGNF